MGRTSRKIDPASFDPYSPPKAESIDAFNPTPPKASPQKRGGSWGWDSPSPVPSQTSSSIPRDPGESRRKKPPKKITLEFDSPNAQQNRQKTAGEQERPVLSPEDEELRRFKLDPINIFEEPGKWFWRTIGNLTHPIKTASKGFGQGYGSTAISIPWMVLEGLSMPFNLPNAMVTSALGFDETASMFEAAYKYSNSRGLSAPLRWSMELAGFAGDIWLGNKFSRSISFGGSTLAKNALQILNESPGIPGLDPIKQKNIRKFSLRAVEPTVENIRDVVVPRLIADTLKFRPSKGGQLAHELPQAERYYFDRNVMEYVTNKKDAKIVNIANRGSFSFEDLRAGFLTLPLSKLKQYSKIDLSLWDPNSPATVAERVKHLAAYAAYAEKDILEGLPYTRLHVGTDFSSWENFQHSKEIGLKIAPSPFPAIGKAFQSVLFNSVRDTPEVRVPLREIVDPALIDEMNNFINASRGYVNQHAHSNTRLALGRYVDVGTLTPIEFDHLMTYLQKNPLSTALDPKEVFSNRAALNVDELRNYVIDEVRQFKTQDNRRLHLESLATTFKVYAKVLEHFPNNYFISESTKIREIISEIEKIQDHNFLSNHSQGQNQLGNIYTLLHGTPKEIHAAGLFPNKFRLDRAMHKFQATANAASTGILGYQAKNIAGSLRDVQDLVNRVANQSLSQSERDSAAALLFNAIVGAKGGPVGLEDVLPTIASAQPKDRAGQLTKETLLAMAEPDKTVNKVAGALTYGLLCFEDLLNTTTAYPVAEAHRRTSQNVMSQIQDIVASYKSLQKSIIDAFELSNIEQMDGISALASLIEDAQFTEFFTTSSRNNYYVQSVVTKQVNPLSVRQYNQYSPKSFQNSTQLQTINTAIKAEFEKKITDKVYRAELSPTKAQELKDFLDRLSPPAFQGLIISLSDISKAKMKGSIQTALMDRLTSTMSSAMNKAERLLMSEHTRELAQLELSFNNYQAIKEPKEKLKFLFKDGGLYDSIDQLIDTVFRRVGFNRGAMVAAQELESTRANIDPAAIEYGKDLSGEILNKTATDISPSIGPRLVSSKDFQKEFSEAAGKFVQYFPTAAGESAHLIGTLSIPDILQAAARARQITSTPALLREGKIYTIAEEKALEAFKKLEEIFGNTNDATKFLKEFSEKIKIENRKQLVMDIDHGLETVPIKDYQPVKILGSSKDKKEFREWIMRKEEKSSIEKADELGEYLLPEREILPGSELPSDRNVISMRYRRAEQRYFRDAAEVEYNVGLFNAEREKLGKEALDIRVDDDIIASMGHRKQNQLAFLADKKALSDLLTYLPQNTIIFKPKTLHEAENIANNLSWKSLKNLIPAMKDYYIPKELHTYLEQFFPKYQAHNMLMNALHWYWNVVSKVTVQFSLIHLKNIAGLAYIAGVNPIEFYEVIRDAVKESAKYEARYPGRMNQMTRIARALEDSEAHKLAVRAGLTHFRGSAQFRSVGENIKLERNPFWSAGRIWDKGAAGTLVFDVMDRGVKITLFNKLTREGVPPQMAATWVNYFLIDYSARNLNPNAKNLGYAMFPFFSWKVQNMLLHLPNMLYNPQRYVTAQFMRNYVTDNFLSTTEYDREYLPEALAKTMPLPYCYDQFGNQKRVMLDFPWDQWIHLFKKTVLKNPFDVISWRSDIYRFILGRSRYSAEVREAMDPYQFNKVRNEKWYETVLDPEEGWLLSDFWALKHPAQATLKLAKSVLNPYQWKDIGPALMEYMAQMSLGDVNAYDARGRRVKPPKPDAYNFIPRGHNL